MRSHTKLIVNIIVWGILGLAAIFIPLTFLVFLKVDKLPPPTILEVISTQTKIYISADDVEGAKYYVFEFSSAQFEKIEIISSTPSTYIDLENSLATVSDQFKTAGMYSVKCYVVGQHPQSKSDYSEIKEFERRLTLNTPTIDFVSNTNSILWTDIEFADLYEIYITSATTSTKIVEHQHTDNPTNTQSVSITQLITQTQLNSGQYQLHIIAKSNNSYFNDSTISNSIIFTVD